MKCPEGKNSVYLFWSQEDMDRHDIWVYFDTSAERQDDRGGVNIRPTHPLHEKLRPIIALFPRGKEHWPITAEEFEAITEGVDYEVS